MNDANLRIGRPRSGGFTLIELVIALAAMSLVILYSLGTFTANRNTYVVIDSVSEAHQNTLAIAGMIERDLRNAGYMVPAAAAACGVDATDAPDMLFVSDTDAIRTLDVLPPEVAGGNLAAEPASVPVTWSAVTTLTLNDVTLDLQPTYDTDLTPGADSDFRKDAGVIITNLDDPTQGVFCGTITNVNASSNQIQITFPPSPPGPGAPGSGLGKWVFVPANVYTVTNGTLLRNGVVMARNVEDLQLAWFYDLNKNGQVDGNEYLGKGDGTVTVLDTSALSDPGELREVRFNLVVKTAEDDPKDAGDVGIGQTRENRTAASAPVADERRRRVHTATVRLRNVS